MNEIFAIAGSTWRNVLRLKVVYFLVFCVWVLVACALNYDVLSLGLEKELLIDASLMLNTITAVLIVLSLTFEIPKELKDGVASSMLSKPLGRTHYLIGKMLGNMVIGFVLCALVAAGSFLIFRVSFNDTVGQTMLQSQVLVILSVIPWSYVVLVTLWGICYAVFAASLASLIFSRKDIR